MCFTDKEVSLSFRSESTLTSSDSSLSDDDASTSGDDVNNINNYCSNGYGKNSVGKRCSTISYTRSFQRSSSSLSIISFSSTSASPWSLWFSYLRRNADSILAGVASATGMVAFSLWFPFFLAPYAASKTYHAAFYSYQAEHSFFDNTAWTYGTDYSLAVIMAILAWTILKYSTLSTTSTNKNERLTSLSTIAAATATPASASTVPSSVYTLTWRSAFLLFCYGVSVIAGGLAHQFYLTLDDRNTLGFRCLWTICVGTVALASIPMGLSGSQVVRQFQLLEETRSASTKNSNSSLIKYLTVIPDAFWWSFGICVTAVCVWGGISFQRPACDIFIAGITQTPSTFYMMVIFGLVSQQYPASSSSSSNSLSTPANSSKVQLWARIMGVIGFILNAPLLPMYPLLIQYTDWSLASVNTLLHTWLCVAWSMQGISLRHVARVILLQEQELQELDGGYEHPRIQEIHNNDSKKQKAY